MRRSSGPRSRPGSPRDPGGARPRDRSGSRGAARRSRPGAGSPRSSSSRSRSGRRRGRASRGGGRRSYLTPCPPLPRGRGGTYMGQSCLTERHDYFNLRSPSPPRGRGGQGVRSFSDPAAPSRKGPPVVLQLPWRLHPVRERGSRITRDPIRQPESLGEVVGHQDQRLAERLPTSSRNWRWSSRRVRASRAPKGWSSGPTFGAAARARARATRWRCPPESSAG